MVKTKYQTSSGGVLFRKGEKQVSIVLIARRDRSIWCLPKGIVETEETVEQAAEREVAEETGLKGRIIGRIGEVNYWFQSKRDNARYYKTVHFFLMEFLGGDTSDHDYEVEEAKWFLADEALEVMTYENERMIVEKALKMIGKIE